MKKLKEINALSILEANDVRAHLQKQLNIIRDSVDVEELGVSSKKIHAMLESNLINAIDSYDLLMENTKW